MGMKHLKSISNSKFNKREITIKKKKKDVHSQQPKQLIERKKERKKKSTSNKKPRKINNFNRHRHFYGHFF